MATASSSTSTVGPSNSARNYESLLALELSDDEIRKYLDDAGTLKDEATQHFRACRWTEALVTYQAALGRLPKRKESAVKKRRLDAVNGKDGTTPETPDDPRDNMPPPLKSDDQTMDRTSQSADGVVDDGDDVDSDEEVDDELTNALKGECAKMRAILNANIGACHVHLGEHKEAVEACTTALADDPLYVKALQRRANSNEQLNTWSSLAQAQEDYKRLLEILPPNSADLRRARQALQDVNPRVEAAQKKETAEMLDKLKGLGNKILGNFGLSTDNFKFEPNGQGGYSMNFVN